MSIAVLILLPIAIGTVSVVAAQNEQFSPPKRFYLALGDSITYGFQQSKVEGGVLNASAFTTGYVDAYVGTQRDAALGPPVFNPQGDVPHEIRTMCTLTLLCAETPDSHPSDAGYRALAGLVFDASDYGRLLR